MTPALVTILMVDDLEENLLALEALLRRDGLRLLRASSGRQALELLLVHDVALALLDVQMPELDGFELAELMRGTTRTRHVPIIFLTAGAQDRQRTFRGYEVGAVDFLFKPIDPVLLGHKVSTFVDLHRRRLESERLTDELREALRLNEMLVAAVSHDLRSPLSTVLIGTTLLADALSDPGDRRTLGRMRSGAERMSAMLDQLYDLARARVGGGIPLVLGEVSLRDLTDRVCEELRLAHPDRSVLVAHNGEPTTGRWDETRLGQVLTNLIGNALRHGSSDQPVVVRLQGTAGSLWLEVHNGGEIVEAIRPHLFDPFRRGSEGRRDSLGLGLYIVQQIVVAHGGTIDVASSRQAGTTFRLQLPLAPR